jgi:5-methylcytosine-specific restriction protein A
MDERCELCERKGVPLTRHHLIPKARGGKDGPTVWLCPDCHALLHQMYDECEITRRLASVDVLRADERLMKDVRFVARQPATRRLTVRRHRRR